MKKEFIIAGNWKMFKTVDESTEFVSDLHMRLMEEDQKLLEHIEVLVFPPFTSLYPVRNISRIIKTGSQNLHFEEQGAFTGEISPLMLKDIVEYVLIGHSERREVFKEQDQDLNKKVKTALKFGFTPVLCIGESLEEREKDQTIAKVEGQLTADLEGLTPKEIGKLVIAYEPIWAIGTGKTATPQQAQEVHRMIRKILEKKLQSKEKAKAVKILYGGSVKPANSFDLLSQNDINGVLVGGASLKVDDFFAIIHNSLRLTNR